MKHFLRLCFIACVLFVLLGLFRQTQETAAAGSLQEIGWEQQIPRSGMLTPQQELPSPVLIRADVPPARFPLADPCHVQENIIAIQLHQQLVVSEFIFQGIKPDLLQRTGHCLYPTSRKEIRS